MTVEVVDLYMYLINFGTSRKCSNHLNQLSGSRGEIFMMVLFLFKEKETQIFYVLVQVMKLILILIINLLSHNYR